WVIPEIPEGLRIGGPCRRCGRRKQARFGPQALAYGVHIAVIMSHKKPGKSEASRQDPLADTHRLIAQDIPHGVDRRGFLMRTAVGGAAAVMTGCSASPEEKTAKAVATVPPPAASSTPPLAPDLDVVQKEKGPVLTTVDEFYKVGPGPSSSHTIGPM